MAHHFQHFWKEQLLLTAENYQLEIPDKKLKESVKFSLEKGILEPGKGNSRTCVGISVSSSSVLNFEQHKELLLFKQKH